MRKRPLNDGTPLQTSLQHCPAILERIWTMGLVPYVLAVSPCVGAVVPHFHCIAALVGTRSVGWALPLGLCPWKGFTLPLGWLQLNIGLVWAVGPQLDFATVYSLAPPSPCNAQSIILLLLTVSLHLWLPVAITQDNFWGCLMLTLVRTQNADNLSICPECNPWGVPMSVLKGFSQNWEKFKQK